MKSLQDKLQKKGLRPSYQRMKILEYLNEHKTHPTVDMIYEDLLKELPTISKTTIYNTLSLFSTKGLTTPLTISGHETRYDGDLSSHSHFLCKRCGGIFDVSGVKLPNINKKIEGNRVEEAHIYLKGLCLNCLKHKSAK